MISSIAKVEGIISSFKSARIAVFGDLMLDVHINGKVERISQEAPVPVVTAGSPRFSLGGAANVIKNLSAYGAKAHAFGVVGRDEFGGQIIRLLKESGCGCEGVAGTPRRGTTRKERIIAGSQQLLRIDYEETGQIPDQVLKPVLDRLLGMIRKRRLDAVVVEDYAKGLVGAEALRLISDECRLAGIICALDPHPLHPFDVKGISLMTPNRSEALALAGLHHAGSDAPGGGNAILREVARRLMRKWSPRELIITLGADGMALFKGTSGRPHIIPTKAREVFDVSGAGDTVIALYTLCLVSGASSEESAEIANHAAGVVVGKIGAATASSDEIIESFRGEGLN